VGWRKLTSSIEGLGMLTFRKCPALYFVCMVPGVTMFGVGDTRKRGL
jgi:hypothetical protein